MARSLVGGILALICALVFLDAISLAAGRVFHQYRHPGVPCSSVNCQFADAATNDTVNLILDTDMDFDDILSVILLASPGAKNVRLLGVSVTGCGAAHLSEGFRNLQRLLNLFPQRQVVYGIAPGFSAPVQYSNVFPFTLRTCADIFYNQTYFQPQPRADIRVYVNAEKMYEDIFNNEPDQSITLLSLGGGTTWARVASKLNPKKLKKIVVMGGAVSPHTGNVQYAFPELDGVRQTPYANVGAEWNVFIDPLGFEQGVLQLSRSLPAKNTLLVTLSACDFVPLNFSITKDLRALGNVAGNLSAGILSHPCLTKDPAGLSLSLWDPTAALAVIDPSIICGQTRTLKVATDLVEGNDTSGALVDFDTGATVTAGMCADNTRVIDLFLRLIGAAP